MSNIIEALQKLDVENDKHWTMGGEPGLDTVRMFAGNPAINRKSIEDVAPGFNRSNAAEYDFNAAAQAQGDENATGDTTPNPSDETPENDAQGSENAPKAHDVEKPAEPAQVTTVNLAELESELEAAEAHTAACRQALADAQAAFKQAQLDEDAVRSRVDAARPKENTGDAIQRYLEASKIEAQKRADALQTLRAAGVNLNELQKALGVSPLDAALANANKGA